MQGAELVLSVRQAGWCATSPGSRLKADRRCHDDKPHLAPLSSPNPAVRRHSDDMCDLDPVRRDAETKSLGHAEQGLPTMI